MLQFSCYFLWLIVIFSSVRDSHSSCTNMPKIANIKVNNSVKIPAKVNTEIEIQCIEGYRLGLAIISQNFL